MRSAANHFLHRASEYSARTKRTRSSCCYPDSSSVCSLDKLQTEQLSAARKTFPSGFTERVHLYDGRINDVEDAESSDFGVAVKYIDVTARCIQAATTVQRDDTDTQLPARLPKCK